MAGEGAGTGAGGGGDDSWGGIAGVGSGAEGLGGGFNDYAAGLGFGSTNFGRSDDVGEAQSQGWAPGYAGPSEFGPGLAFDSAAAGFMGPNVVAGSEMFGGLEGYSQSFSDLMDPTFLGDLASFAALGMGGPLGMLGNIGMQGFAQDVFGYDSRALGDRDDAIGPMGYAAGDVAGVDYGGNVPQSFAPNAQIPMFQGVQPGSLMEQAMAKLYGPQGMNQMPVPTTAATQPLQPSISSIKGPEELGNDPFRLQNV